MGKKKIWLAAILLAPLAANAAVVTYDFTGRIFSPSALSNPSAFSNVVSGESVQGSFSFDYGAANPSQSSGTPGLPPWNFVSNSGSDFGLPTSGSMLSMTMTVGSGASAQVFQTLSAASLNNQSHVSSGGTIAWFAGSNVFIDASGDGSFATLQMNGFAGGPGFTPSGLPQFSPGADIGAFSESLGNNAGGNFSFVIDTMTPVPLPAAAWLLLSGLGGLGAFLRKKLPRPAGT
jgi:hypothetical protein